MVKIERWRFLTFLKDHFKPPGTHIKSKHPGPEKNAEKDPHTGPGNPVICIVCQSSKYFATGNTLLIAQNHIKYKMKGLIYYSWLEKYIIYG